MATTHRAVAIDLISIIEYSIHTLHHIIIEQLTSQHMSHFFELIRVLLGIELFLTHTANPPTLPLCLSFVISVHGITISEQRLIMVIVLGLLCLGIEVPCLLLVDEIAELFLPIEVEIAQLFAQPTIVSPLVDGFHVTDAFSLTATLQQLLILVTDN